ncbi:hypothetical protein ABFV57_33260, partial [Pseudomonas neuropathica]
PQEICDVSSRFVSKNPAQLNKRVSSVTPAVDIPIQAFQVPDRNMLQGAINHYLIELNQRLVDGVVPAGKNGKVTVFILGRYK